MSAIDHQSSTVSAADARRTLVVIQARTGSTRLPGKVRLPLAGKTLLERMVERVRAAKTPFELVVATTVEASDDPLVALCDEAKIPCFRGHPTDLLERHYGAALAVGPQIDTVVKIPSDCPLIDPAVIDRVLAAHFASGGNDFTSNLHPATYPDGNDVEVMTLAALAIAHREADRTLEREHTTPFLWERPDRFRVGNVTWESGLDFAMSHRFTIDYPEDYDFIKAVYDALWRPERPIFGLDDILRLLEARPEIAALNAKYAGVNWYRHHLGELRTITARETRAL
ncbi:N-Acetylneuraminate cytidylyltransferase [Minicystis rosea]|nr:N-Acetylneuraminate cytidylyltransferase [Minicystis rosea]